jgi:hypothetical protein
MRRVPLVLAITAACGGTPIPEHNGYRSDKAKPWKKFKTLKFNDKGEAKSDGDLSYPDMRRAKWFSIDAPSDGDLTLRVEVTPPGESTNEDFDLAMELLDPGNHVINKADLEESDAHELTKTRTVKVAKGTYLVHLYLQGRLDTADFVLRASFKGGPASERKTNFPAQVAFVPILPLVPVSDDTPPGKIKKDPTPVTHVTHKVDPVVKKPDPPPAATVSARIIGVTVVTGGTRITVGLGTESKPTPAAVGMKVKLTGVSGVFSLGACGPRSCTADVQATPDQVKAAGGSVVLSP